MQLEHPFYRLNLRFDAGRLQEEIASLPEASWVAHPNGYAGNSSLVLMSVGGTVNDEFAIAGPMQPTAELRSCPYILQVLASLEAPISRTRLMRLDGRHQVPRHYDHNYHWYRRTRVHIPIVTHPSVKFVCDGESVHMPAGEAWTFDNTRKHEVLNPHEQPRIHLVVDTRGSELFWKKATPMLDSKNWDAAVAQHVPYRSGISPNLSIEPYRFEVLTPEEIDKLIANVETAFPADAKVKAFLSRFRENWRVVFNRFGDSRTGELAYAELLAQFRWEIAHHRLHGAADAAFSFIATMLNTTNRTVPFVSTGEESRTEGEVEETTYHFSADLRYMKTRNSAKLPQGTSLSEVVETCFSSPSSMSEAAGKLSSEKLASQPLESVVCELLKMKLVEPVASFDHPVFIVSAPRSGSTLLFETLAQAHNVWTIGGESHGVIETIPGLHPRDKNWASNCLTAADAQQPVAGFLQAAFTRLLRDRAGCQLDFVKDSERIRLLAKTPKDALRVPFLKAVFPEARFIFLYREPHEAISSILDGWRSRRFVTYAKLPGWDAIPWSFLLPPGWRDYRDASLAETAAFQWNSANRSILNDLQGLPHEDWCVVHYDKLIAAPEVTIRQLCEFAEWEFDQHLGRYLREPLPLSRHTLSAPSPEKWRKNEAELAEILPLTRDFSDQLSMLEAA